MTSQIETVFIQGVADVEPGVRLHCVMPGEGDRTAILFHGFPQATPSARPVR
jgi:hypothetical protein